MIRRKVKTTSFKSLNNAGVPQPNLRDILEILCSTILYYTRLDYTVLYYIILYYTIPYYTII